MREIRKPAVKEGLEYGMPMEMMKSETGDIATG